MSPVPSLCDVKMSAMKGVRYEHAGVVKSGSTYRPILIKNEKDVNVKAYSFFVFTVLIFRTGPTRLCPRQPINYR